VQPGLGPGDPGGQGDLAALSHAHEVAQRNFRLPGLIADDVRLAHAGFPGQVGYAQVQGVPQATEPWSDFHVLFDIMIHRGASQSLGKSWAASSRSLYFCTLPLAVMG